MKSRKKSIIALALLITTVLICMLFADIVQCDFGNVEVTMGTIETEDGTITYKLYTPSTATAEDPAAAVLLLHGYQNDHETCAAYAIELARRGVVVMAIDEYGHGSTTISMINRGYVNHKVTVNYGNDSEDDGTYVEVGGALPYRVMINFSNPSFFDEYYSTDSDGNSIIDSSMGGIAAYAVLAGLENVDASRMAISGHSMGTWASWTTAAAYSGATDENGVDISPKAVVLQCGELFSDDVYDSETITFNNVLLLQAKYDEFSYFRDYSNVVDDSLLTTSLRLGFLGCSADEAAWNTTYGSFTDGTARRIQLLYTNHRLSTNYYTCLATALEWFDEAIDIDSSLAYTNQIAMVKEVLVLVAMLAALAAMIPLLSLLLSTKFFASVRQPMPTAEKDASN